MSILLIIRISIETGGIDPVIICTKWNRVFQEKLQAVHVGVWNFYIGTLALTGKISVQDPSTLTRLLKQVLFL